MVDIWQREIERWAAPYFADHVGDSGDEWISFLNARTGIRFTKTARMGDAFDGWRKALSGDFPDIWPHG